MKLVCYTDAVESEKATETNQEHIEDISPKSNCLF